MICLQVPRQPHHLEVHLYQQVTPELHQQATLASVLVHLVIHSVFPQQDLLLLFLLDLLYLVTMLTLVPEYHHPMVSAMVSMVPAASQATLSMLVRIISCSQSPSLMTR